MKNRYITFAWLVLGAGLITGCGGAAKNGNASGNSAKANANAEAFTPAIAITSEALAKEWLADPAATDSKYKGKVLAVTGELYLAQKISEEYFVRITGVMSAPKVKGAKVECSAGQSSDAMLLVKAREANERMLKESPTAKMPPSPTITVKGTYLSSTPPDNPAIGSIDLKPCEIVPTTH